MKKKIVIATLSLTAMLLLTLFFGEPEIFLRVFGSPADAYGNDIVYIEVWQGGSLKANFTSTGGSVRIDANQQVDFVVCIKFNSTLASSESEAISYTKVLMNITYSGNYIWQNKELNNTSIFLSNGFYWLKEVGNWTSNLPQEGITYNCAVLYQGYY
ncbi:MAG: hypothetical protein ACK40U_10395 [Fervidobacterium pennivorans]